MGEQPAAAPDPVGPFLAFYDDALPVVYGYLSARCGARALAEDLTAETFLASVRAAGGGQPAAMTVPWVIGVARHKLVDHWRRQARDQRHLSVLGDAAPATEDPWPERLEAVRVAQVLQGMAAQHRAALTLRYLDDLSVPEVARLLGRTVHATEALLVRARLAFRRAYEHPEASDA